jgi:hypothetical protein
MSKNQENQALPLFYKQLVPLNSGVHAASRARTTDKASWLAKQHAVPLMTDEFAKGQRSYPIIFSASENPVPLVLMGMNEGVNTFMNDEGHFERPVYIPAYVRRYPFLLAKLRPDTDELSLCFDPTSGAVGEFEEGMPLFEDSAPSENTKAILKFCEDFENAGAQTHAFVEEITKLDLLMDGEVSIQQEGQEQPFIYRGFKMIDENKLRELRGDTVRKLNQNGILALIHAHLFSLQLMREIFAVQVAQGKVPQVMELPSN